jgi:hypothetical protein
MAALSSSKPMTNDARIGRENTCPANCFALSAKHCSRLPCEGTPVGAMGTKMLSQLALQSAQPCPAPCGQTLHTLPAADWHHTCCDEVRRQRIMAHSEAQPCLVARAHDTKGLGRRRASCHLRLKQGCLWEQPCLSVCTENVVGGGS